MEARRLGDRLYLVPGSPNTLVYLGSVEPVYVDPGIGEGRGEWLASRYGRGLVLLTHGHTDHLAEAPRVARVVAAHRLCVGLAESWALRASLVYGGLVSRGYAAMPPVEVRVHWVLDWGERILDAVYAIRLDGHTPGHTGYVFEDEGVVAVGDALVGERVVERYGLPYALDARRWLETLEAIRRLGERGYTVIPGHGPVLRGEKLEKTIEANRKAVEEAKRLVLEAVAEKPRTLDELALLVTQRLASIKPTPRNLSLNRVTVSSILAWLHEEGLVEPRVGGRGVEWAAKKA